MLLLISLVAVLIKAHSWRLTAPETSGQLQRSQRPGIRQAQYSSGIPIQFLLIGWPLEAQAIPVGIVKVQLLHAVGRDVRLFYLETLGAKMSIRCIHVRAAKINNGVVVGGNAGEIRDGRPRIFVLHKLR